MRKFLHCTHPSREWRVFEGIVTSGGKIQLGGGSILPVLKIPSHILDFEFLYFSIFNFYREPMEGRAKALLHFP